jgi:hypothetical protein
MVMHATIPIPSQTLRQSGIDGGDGVSSGVFVLKDQDTLVAMQTAQFASEDDFQRLLAKFPDLLAGAQIDPASPRRWVLVSREKSVPSEEGGGGRWSIDHLFLDQDGIPTIVEVKRQSNTEIRRKVVGQMLDYAANAVAYWPVEELRSVFNASCKLGGLDPAVEIERLIGSEEDPEAFWQRVKTNLQAGRIRMLFVADEIPPELRRIVEFLNAQMDPAEVLALELQQYEGQGLKTIVPLVIGQTQEAQQKKTAGAPQRQWDEEAIYADLGSRVGPQAVQTAKKIADWMRGSGGTVYFGRGIRDGSMNVAFDSQGHKLPLFSLLSNGSITVRFGEFKKPPFDADGKRRELLQRLNAVSGVALSDDMINRFPSISLSVLSEPKQLAKFLEAADWFVAEVRDD